MRVAVCQINPTAGDLKGNGEKVIQWITEGEKEGAAILLFPELALTGYPAEDFLLLPHFLEECVQRLKEVAASVHSSTAIVGVPRRDEQGRVWNSAAVLEQGKVVGYHDKCLLPNYDVFDEKRYFTPADSLPLWKIQGKRVALTICEDLWQRAQPDGVFSQEKGPLDHLAGRGVDLVLNLSASPFSLEKAETRERVFAQVARELGAPVILCNQVGGNDSLIFDGGSLWVSAEGELLFRGESFVEQRALLDLAAAPPKLRPPLSEMERLHGALVLGVRDYFHKLGFTQACVGLSGGIDSAVVAAIGAEALGPDQVLGIAMPSRYSSDHSRRDAQVLAENLGLSFKEISIESCFQSYLDLLEPHFAGLPSDVTEENLQARVRGMILMAHSNKQGHLVLSPGNKSEVALGYCTLYGDTCGGLAVINDVVKSRVYALAHFINREEERIPLSTLTKPPSAELRPHQKDADTLPDYAVVDQVIEDYVERQLSPEEIVEKRGLPEDLVKELVRKIHFNEYKRGQMAPGLRVTEKAFSQGRRFPIVQGFVR